jgi:hypothetical protein
VDRRLAWIALMLLLTVAAAPAVEAVVACPQVCADEAEGSADDCSDDACCSCCVHARFAAAEGAQGLRFLVRGECLPKLTHVPSAAAPRGILHVPKSLTA